MGRWHGPSGLQIGNFGFACHVIPNRSVLLLDSESETLLRNAFATPAHHVRVRVYICTHWSLICRPSGVYVRVTSHAYRPTPTAKTKVVVINRKDRRTSSTTRSYSRLNPSKIFVSSFNFTGLVRKRSIPHAYASCCALALPRPVRATMVAGGRCRLCSNCRICRVAS